MFLLFFIFVSSGANFSRETFEVGHFLGSWSLPEGVGGRAGNLHPSTSLKLYLKPNVLLQTLHLKCLFTCCPLKGSSKMAELHIF